MTAYAQDWMFARGQAQSGPVSLPQLQQMATAGQLHPNDLVWRDGMPQWVQAAAVPELFAPGSAAAPLPQAPPQIGYYSYQPSANYVEYAGFWLRFVAYIIDYLVMLVPGIVVQVGLGLVTGAAMRGSASQQTIEVVAQLVGILVGLIIAWLYYALMESSQRQATLGKMALGLVVTDLEGGRLSFGRATGRHFGKIVSLLILGIGYMMAGWTQRKQALHDSMANALVVRRR
jgi:uncharacterized RDD family membrane protein YckC